MNVNFLSLPNKATHTVKVFQQGPAGHCSGLTLIELLVALAVLSVLIGKGVPTVSSVVTSNRVASQVNNLRGDLAFARSEAVKRGQRVVLCQSDDGVICSNKKAWQTGWIIFSDPNQNNTREPLESLLRVQPGITNAMTLSNNIALGNDGRIVYWPTGTTRYNGTFTFCHIGHPDKARALIYNRVGRVYLKHTKASGKPLDC